MKEIKEVTVGEADIQTTFEKLEVLRKKNKLDTVIHILAGAYDLYATFKHYRKIGK